MLLEGGRFEPKSSAGNSSKNWLGTVGSVMTIVLSIKKCLHSKFDKRRVTSSGLSYSRLDSPIHRINLYPEDSAISFPNTYLALVVQRLDSATYRINLYPVDNAISFPNTYPLDSDLSRG